MKAYIAGPMQGIADFNFPAFHAAAKKYREQGWVVFSPAEKDIEKHGEGFEKGSGDMKEAEKKGFSLRDALAVDLEWVARNADAIVMLPGWENSKGAQAEWALARALNLKIIYE